LFRTTYENGFEPTTLGCSALFESTLYFCVELNYVGTRFVFVEMESEICLREQAAMIPEVVLKQYGQIVLENLT
jgi:hypothetical protein